MPYKKNKIALLTSIFGMTPEQLVDATEYHLDANLYDSHEAAEAVSEIFQHELTSPEVLGAWIQYIKQLPT